MVWSYSKTVYEELLKTVLDPDFGDITDPESGFDLKVSYDKISGKMYPETTVRPRPKASKLSKDPNQVEEWLANLPDIDAMQNRKTPAEVEEILNGYLMSDDADAEDLASETVRTGGGSRVANALADLV